MDDFFLLTGVGIARESCHIISAVLLLLRLHCTLLAISCFCCYNSLPRLLDRFLVAKLALRIQTVFDYVGGLNILAHNHYFTQLFYHKLSETILSNVLCFPFLATFLLWARAVVAHTVADTYAGHRPSWYRLIQQLPKLWKRLVETYIWVCMLILGFNALMFVLMSAIINGVYVLGLPAVWGIGVFICGGILYAIVFAHAMIVCNLATVVCVMEADCCYGLDAVFKAMYLIRGRTQIALLMALVANMSLALVESLFQYRVMGMKHGSSFYNENSSRISSSAIEVSLLIFMYSMVGVMESVISCVFYYICKSSRLELGTYSCLNYSYFLNPVKDEFSCGEKINLSEYELKT